MKSSQTENERERAHEPRLCKMQATTQDQISFLAKCRIFSPLFTGSHRHYLSLFGWPKSFCVRFLLAANRQVVSSLFPGSQVGSASHPNGPIGSRRVDKVKATFICHSGLIMSFGHGPRALLFDPLTPQVLLRIHSSDATESIKFAARNKIYNYVRQLNRHSHG